MATTNSSKLNVLFSLLPAGSPVTSAQLAAMGISADLAVHYVRAGWLRRLARGVFCRPFDALLLHPSLLLIQQQVAGLHVGGKSALEWYGIRQYVPHHAVLQLYGWAAARLPAWFTEHFPAEYHRKRLFKEDSTRMLHVGPFTTEGSSPWVSAPERAFLELLSEVGVRQPLDEVREITQSMYTLRYDVMLELLQQCRSVKTVRLGLMLGREYSLPWVARLDEKKLPRGSKRPWISKSRHGLLVLK